MIQPAHPTEGHVRIAALVDNKGGRWVARQLGCDEATVRQWLRDGCTPQKRKRELAEKKLGLPLGAWSVRPGGRVVASPEIAAAEPAPEPGPPPEPPAGTEDPRSNLLAILRALRIRLETAKDREVVELSNAIARTSALLAKIDGSIDITEPQILRSQAWARLIAKMRGVLEAFPEAAQALEKAFTEEKAA